MAKKLKILIESDGLVQTLGMQAPIMTPTLVTLKDLMKIVNEGHKVKAITPSGVNVVIDEDYVKKMITRGDTGAEKVWNKIKEESKKKSKSPKTKIDTQKKKSSTSDEEDNKDKEDKQDKEDDKSKKKSYTSSNKKKYKKSSSKKKDNKDN